MKVTVVVSRDGRNGYRAVLHGRLECATWASTLGELVRKVRETIKAAAGPSRPKRS